MRTVVLDSEAISRLARSRDGATAGTVHKYIQAASITGSNVVVPAAVLAEQYRGGHHDQMLDACLTRYPGIHVINATRALARRIGNLLAQAGVGSAHHVDATVVAVALDWGAAIVLTSDPDDLTLLASGSPNVTIIAL